MIISHDPGAHFVEMSPGVYASYDPFAAQAAHVAASHQVDRRGWTREQWIDDAERLMNDDDGSVLDLVNGHVYALLAELKELRG